MWNGKLKALTFSYDDGVTQDKRLIEIFNKYGIKATFNINSQLLGKNRELIIENKTISHNKVKPEEISSLYSGHEVAVHTLTHTLLTKEDDDEVIRQVEEDRKNLEILTENAVVGMAYPCGGENNDDRVARLVREHTGVCYARTIKSTFSFELQDNLYRFNPTVYHYRDFDKMLELGEKFLNLSPDRPMIYYIWGHSYEFDINNTWDIFEEFCKKISCKEDIFYGTNSEVLLNNDL